MTQTRTEASGDAAASAGQAAVLLQRVVHKLVAEPEAVEVAIKIVGDTTYLKLRLAPRDLQTIKATPRTIASLKCIVTSLGQRSGRHFVLHCHGIDEASL